MVNVTVKIKDTISGLHKVQPQDKVKYIQKFAGGLTTAAESWQPTPTLAPQPTCKCPYGDHSWAVLPWEGTW